MFFGGFLLHKTAPKKHGTFGCLGLRKHDQSNSPDVWSCDIDPSEILHMQGPKKKPKKKITWICSRSQGKKKTHPKKRPCQKQTHTKKKTIALAKPLLRFQGSTRRAKVNFRNKIAKLPLASSTRESFGAPV